MKKVTSLLLTAVMAVSVIFGMGGFMGESAFASTAPGNLLINPSFEQFTDTDGERLPVAWVNPSGAFGCESKDRHLDSDQKAAIDGEYYCWPRNSSNYPGGKGASSGQTVSIYQDVDVSAYETDTMFTLSGLLCNYNQAPHDEAILTLGYYDDKGQLIGERIRNQRNPQINRASISMAKPAKAEKLRVTCTAKGHVGFDVDGYFDDLNLVATGEKKASDVIIFGNASLKAGKSTTLKAYNGKTNDPKKFTWVSSYEEYATVDSNGKVSLTSKYTPEEGVSIYVTDKESGLTSEFRFGKSVKNDQDKALSKPTGLKATKIAKTEVVISWKKNTKVDGYYFQKYDTKKKAWVNMKTLKKTTYNCNVKGLKSKTTYKYRVVAFKKFGTYTLKATSSSISVKTK